MNDYQLFMLYQIFFHRYEAGRRTRMTGRHSMIFAMEEIKNVVVNNWIDDKRDEYYNDIYSDYCSQYPDGSYKNMDEYEHEWMIDKLYDLSDVMFPDIEDEDMRVMKFILKPKKK